MSESPIYMVSKYQQLLRELKTTVEGLLASQVPNVWDIYGGLNRLYNAIEKIFKHGCKKNIDNDFSDYWNFIEGLEWLQPDRSTFTVDCEYKSYVPAHLKNDKASIWLYYSLENHSLSQKLSWLLSDQSHLNACYQSYGFLQQKQYTESVLLCLRAVEKNQPSLLSEIDPVLFLNKSGKDLHRYHRRCSSFPDRHLNQLNQPMKTKSKSFILNNEMVNIPAPKIKVYGKLRPYSSMPDLCTNKTQKVTSQSNTTPSTPTCSRNMSTSLSILKTLPLTKKSKTKIKHVIINNVDIIEHTLPSSTARMNESHSFPQNRVSQKSNQARSVPDYGFLSPLSGEKDYKKQPKKSFIEDGGMSVLPMATGYFPRPTKGQTLTSFLTLSKFTRTNAELDRENAHFSISEAMIAAIEQIHCKRDLKLAEEQVEESDEEIMELKQRIRLRRRQKLEEKQRKMCAASILSSDSKTDTTNEPSLSPCSTTPDSLSLNSTDDIDDLEIDEISNLSDQRGLSMSMASLYSDADLFKSPREAPDGASDVLSAEGVALSLISRFNEKQLPRASDLEWLVSEEDAPQALLPLPKSWPVSPDDTEQSPETPLRGTRDWAPPRPQIIFTYHPPPSRNKLMAKQNYRCAGCGMKVASQYASKFRYCDYLGRYFCTGCHTNQLSIIPGRVIQKWDFTRYPVSNFSYRLLEQMYMDPLFRIFELNKRIGKRSKNLEICQRYRLGLFYLKDFILTCRFAETIQEYLEREPLHIVNNPDIYSINDLVETRNGYFKSKLKHLVEMCYRHICECQLCSARGFICELCHAKESIFPWQMKTVIRCNKCGSCFHSKCWNTDQEPCAKCLRINKRKETVQDVLV